MEKLLKLLNEYSPDYCKDYPDDIIMDEIVISKRFGFIKWLVDNDKIDRKKLEIRPFSDGLVYSDSDCTVYRSDTTYEMLLMLLAISDKPIYDLISYLK